MQAHCVHVHDARDNEDLNVQTSRGTIVQGTEHERERSICAYTRLATGMHGVQHSLKHRHSPVRFLLCAAAHLHQRVHTIQSLHTQTKKHAHTRLGTLQAITAAGCLSSCLLALLLLLLLLFLCVI